MIGNVPTLTLTVSILSATVVCFKRFQLEIPNGDKVPNPCNKNELWTAVGHTTIEGGGRRNPFGQVFQNQKTWGGMLCDSDSDGDGMTNGAELGDPDCDWVKGRTPKRTENITHPGICEPMDSERCKEKNSWLRCPEDPNAFCPELSKPDVKSLDLKLDKTRVPATSTTWMCQILPWPEEGDFHVIGSKPLVDNADVTHHMIVFGCGSTVSQRPGPYQCNMVPDRECQDILLTWTMGSKGECLHKEEGFRMGSKGYTHVALQVHWNNINQRSTYVDGSGIQVFYTNKLRKYDSVIMVVGQKYLELPPNAPVVTVNSSCPAFCTENMFQKPIFITRAVNHMHTLGKKQQVALYRDGGFVRNITNDEVYDYNSPFFYRFDKPIEVRPGDEIRTTCTYSTVGINRTIFYGVSIKDEMCYSFLTYFPHQRSYTQFCTTFKDTQVCKRYLPRLQGVYDDCSWRAFINGKDMTAVEMTKRVETECGKTDSCSASCSDALDVMSKHPCMHGEIHGYVSEKWPMMKQVRAYRKMCMNPPDVSNPSSAGAKAEDSKSGSAHLSNNYLAVISAVMLFLRSIVV